MEGEVRSACGAVVRGSADGAPSVPAWGPGVPGKLHPEATAEAGWWRFGEAEAEAAARSGGALRERRLLGEARAGGVPGSRGRGGGPESDPRCPGGLPLTWWPSLRFSDL